jgi:DNA topoisomerase-1
LGKALVIVESPAKARTITRLLGRGYTVKASLGHVRDLPAKRLAVDVDRDFAPQYEVIKGREKVLTDLKKTAKTATAVYLATDPDREGEAICWHLGEVLGQAKTPVHRVTFHEITPRAVREAFKHPGTIDPKKVEAQQARRILDRLVGYKISPILWEKVRRGISAGRVQSVALRLIVDREREVLAFVSREYWTVEARLAGAVPPDFTAKLVRIDGEKPGLSTEAEAQRVVAGLGGQAFVVTQVVKKERRRNPVPPFITSRLQQEAIRKLGWTARKTMQVAQQLYEGIELGAEGAVGLITYMRTDSTQVSADAQAEAAAYIAARYGPDFVPPKPPTYRSRKGAQEAHEAIRPTSVARDPAAVVPHLTRDQLALYTLIWNRFVASQMRSALYDVTTVEIEAGRFGLRATGSVLRFAGFTQVYVEGRDEAVDRGPAAPSEEEAAEEAEATAGQLPPLVESEALTCRAITPGQHFTQPPPRYTEATLVKELEERGIGRPSTYATILGIIQNRDYVTKAEGKFRPTELGMTVVDYLVERFPRIMDPAFTARMESTLDEVEEGQANWLEEMRRFWGAFQNWLEGARSKPGPMQREEPTEETCAVCGRPMVKRWGIHGHYLACSGYPECRNTRDLAPEGPAENGDGAGNGAGEAPACENCGRPMRLRRGRYGEFWGCTGYPECKTIVKVARGESKRAAPPEPTDQVCEKCGSPMVLKDGRYGRFLACSAYPKCKNIKGLPIGVACPQCGAPLAERRSKRGKPFYGCTAYPACTFALWDRPVAEACPQCGAPFLVEKWAKGARTLRCTKEGCGYVRGAAPAAAGAERAPAGTP